MSCSTGYAEYAEKVRKETGSPLEYGGTMLD